ncbi:MAG TPA: hypothetical protein PJ986_20425 [Gammaproteobacteria bacterium]|nr:hypothetical protein [Gammaproteobacteria bacterium]
MSARRCVRQGGFSLMSAIFLIVVVALIAGYAVSIGNAQRSGSGLALLGARAGFAAQSGVEWAVATVLATHACPAAGTRFPVAGPGLAGFEIEIDCSAAPVTEGATSYTMFSLAVAASHAGENSEDYAFRRISAQVADGAP